MESCIRIKDGNGWHRGSTKCERSGRSILKICIISILKTELRVALMGFGEATTSEES